MFPPTIKRYPISVPFRKGDRTTISSVRPGINRVQAGWPFLRVVLLIGMGLVFLGASACSLGELTPTDPPFVPPTLPFTSTPTQPETQTPTLTPTLTPSPEYPSGAATILQLQGLMSIQVAGQSTQVAEPGLTIPATAEIMFTTSDIAELELSDGSQVFLGEDTTITLISVASPSSLDTVIQIQQGLILVGATQLTIRASTAVPNHPFQAQVADGWMGVIYQPEAGQFLVDCLSGTCQMDDLALNRGQRRGFNDSILSELGDAQYDFWQALFLFDDIPLFTLTPVATNTPTPSRTPTKVPITSAPPTPTPAPTQPPQPEPTNPPPPPPPPPEPTDTATSVPIATDTPTSVSPP